MDRLTQTSDRGGVAFTFDLDIICKPSEAQKILKLAEKLKQYEDLGTVEELKQAKEQYDNINSVAESIALSGLCDFNTAKESIISEIKRNYK